MSFSTIVEVEDFLESPRSEHNALAYSSFGRPMEESRFYFADAAAERAVNMY
jgi:hypothetical protein